MLTPSTRATIRPRSLSTSALSRTQTRTLFGWKSRFGAVEAIGAVAGPFAGFGAFVGGFGAVVEAELAARRKVC